VTLSPKLDDPAGAAQFIKLSAQQLGISHCAITDTNLEKHEAHLLDWLDDGFHGEMEYMERHGTRRSRPADLVEGTVRIISVRLDYFPPEAEDANAVLASPERAYVSRYALGRDYHKVLRNRIQKLAKVIEEKYGSFGYRAFVDSAPVLDLAGLANTATYFRVMPAAGFFWESYTQTCLCLLIRPCLNLTVVRVWLVLVRVQRMPLLHLTEWTPDAVFHTTR
jgi:hypothetical protein